MTNARSPRPWTRHFGLPQIPVVIVNPKAFVQIKEDGVRGRCRVVQADEVDWERVTHWRWGDSGRPQSDPDKMTLQDCVEERRRIDADRTRIEAELLVAKRRQDDDAIRDLGHRIQALNQQAAELKLRRHALVTQANVDAYKRAAQEILPPDLLRKLYDRANAIQQEMTK
ncbi:hypothetical protein [Sphingobium chungbukense]|uniref:Uncharacterized protein n=1 Tax=Sphingobium chungbukense TaxID=56193 RepID=A0A0M3AQ17_9SPHN|nr:hypothetical protein [Sphingobium chungbukense]KKW92277.1 hypothetical protein YP76_10120 [Sphingobium chungbukense]